MNATLPLNDATAEEIALLLGIDAQEATAAAEAAPFADNADLQARAPASVAAGGLDLLKLDVNTAATGQVRAVVGTDAAAAAIIVARPIHDLRRLRDIRGVGPSVFARLTRVFHTGVLTLWDAEAGNVHLEADPGAVVLRMREDAGDAEAALVLDGTARLRSVMAEGTYQLVEADDTEGAARDLATVSSRRAVSAVLPTLRDADGNRRYADTGYLNVQFSDGVSEGDVREALDLADLTPHRRMRTPGLLLARLRDASGGLRAISRAVAILRGHPKVRIAEPAWIGFSDMECADTTTFDGESAMVFDHVASLGLQKLWTITRGVGEVAVVVVDTGWDTDHPALADHEAERGGEDWNFVGGEADRPQDRHGHGTFVAGLVGGQATAGVRGVAPSARVIALRVPLFASLESYARRREAILAAAALAETGARVVVNCSWRTAGDVALIRGAIEDAAAAGALVVASAGNDPRAGDAPHYPSDYPVVLSVGATGADGSRAIYSQFGVRVDIAAPGGDGPSGPNLQSAALGGGTRTDWGTSFAAALVSGVAALVWSASPTRDAAAVRRLLQETADPLPAAAALGAGRLSATALADRLGVFDPLPPPDTPVPDPCATAGPGALDAFTMEDLVARFGLIPFTARLLVHKRPFQDWDEVRGLLGLTASQFAALQAAASGHT